MRFTVWEHSPVRIGIWKCWLLWREGNRSAWRKTSRSTDENQQQTQPTYDAKSSLVGGECSHHCTIPAVYCLLFHQCFKTNQPLFECFYFVILQLSLMRHLVVLMDSFFQPRFQTSYLFFFMLERPR